MSTPAAHLALSADLETPDQTSVVPECDQPIVERLTTILPSGQSVPAALAPGGLLVVGYGHREPEEFAADAALIVAETARYEGIDLGAVDVSRVLRRFAVPGTDELGNLTLHGNPDTHRCSPGAVPITVAVLR